MLTPRILLGYFFQLCHLLAQWDTGRIDVLAVNSVAGNTWAIDPSPTPFLASIPTMHTPTPPYLLRPWIMIKKLWHHEKNK